MVLKYEFWQRNCLAGLCSQIVLCHRHFSSRGIFFNCPDPYCTRSYSIPKTFPSTTSGDCRLLANSASDCHGWFQCSYKAILSAIFDSCHCQPREHSKRSGNHYIARKKEKALFDLNRDQLFTSTEKYSFYAVATVLLVLVDYLKFVVLIPAAHGRNMAKCIPAALDRQYSSLPKEERCFRLDTFLFMFLDLQAWLPPSFFLCFSCFLQGGT